MLAKPERVAIVGYTGAAMEPFVTPDARYLLFNNSNDPAIDTHLHYAERIDALSRTLEQRRHNRRRTAGRPFKAPAGQT